jgi:hypothetical protein
VPIGALISGGSSLLGGIIGGIGASSASKQQAAAAKAAQQQITQGLNQGEQALTNAGADVKDTLSPYTGIGLGATSQLSNLLTSTPGPTSGGYQTGTGGVLEGWNQQFQAPTTSQLTDPNNPQYAGYQFALNQGEQAIQNSAAARGDLFSSNTAKSLDQYAQGTAAQYAQQQYQNAFGQYNQAYNQFQQNQGNTFNRLFGLSQAGQGAAGQLAGLQGGLAGQYANLVLGGNQAIAQTMQQGGAASASGTVGLANALSGGIGNAGQTALLASLLGQNQGGPQSASGYGGPISGVMPSPGGAAGTNWLGQQGYPVPAVPNILNQGSYTVPMSDMLTPQPSDIMGNTGA